jgi:nicotinamidase-related amidase
MDTALLLIDIQCEYFPGGRRELYQPLEASLQAGKLLAWFRTNRLPVIHIQHIAAKPGAATFIPGTPGVEIHPNVAPQAGETVIVKHFPNSFHETALLDTLRGWGIQRLVICGMQTNMCVDATTRAATDLGFACRVAGDACAARDLSYGGLDVPAAQVHAAFLAALMSSYGPVLATDELLAQLETEKSPV